MPARRGAAFDRGARHICLPPTRCTCCRCWPARSTSCSANDALLGCAPAASPSSELTRRVRSHLAELRGDGARARAYAADPLAAQSCAHGCGRMINQGCAPGRAHSGQQRQQHQQASAAVHRGYRHTGKRQRSQQRMPTHSPPRFSVVWCPIPIISYIFPPIGHMGEMRAPERGRCHRAPLAQTCGAAT